MNNHPFHLVEQSPWPILSSFSLLNLILSITNWMHKSMLQTMMMSLTMLLMTMIQWWRDIIRESTFQGLHTKKVENGMKLGMLLFIISEVMFFISFFWTFLHSSLAPSIEIGCKWPPKGVISLNPINIPLLNTMILLSSGISITWAHNSLLTNNLSQTIKSMIMTIFMGIYFSLIQMMEYYETTFTMSDSVYGSVFFMSTGFHGMHVIIGTMFIIISALRIKNLHMSLKHHMGFEASAWYWHFVDVVWMFLYILVYWWGK